MAGRGRGATLPSWMTQQLAENSVNAGEFPARPPDAVISDPKYRDAHGDSRRYDDASSKSNGDVDYSDRDRDRGKDRDRDRHSDRRDRRSRSRSKDRKSRRRSKSRSRSRDRRERDKSEREPSPPSQKSASAGWRAKKREKSNFDMLPPDGIALPPIGVNSSAGESFVMGPVGGPGVKRDVLASTRHARRIYVGGIPATSTEHEIGSFFNDLCKRGVSQSYLPNDGGPPIANVYLNLEKCFAFVEMPTIELATAAMKLDGIQYKHFTGLLTLRIRRPHDYKPELVPQSGDIPEFNLPEFNGSGMFGNDVAGRVFVGGIPYHLGEDQIRELLQAFGPLKSFNLVREPGTNVSKGYGFCEYFDDKTTNIAVQGLNDMQIGDKRLTVRVTEVKNVGGGMQANPFMNISGLPSGPAGLPASAPIPLMGQIPTKVLRLENMVTPVELQDDEEYEDIVNDVREECSQYGSVQTVLIPRTKSGFPPQTEGFIFVLFSDLDSSINAALKLYGRKFADRIVKVNYFDESKFLSGLLL